MVYINLLPHRAEKRAQRRRDFYTLIGLTIAGAVVIVVAVIFVINGYINLQTARNDFIKGENAKLDAQIKEIASLRQDLEALKARQKAVEDLQADRNLPVHLLDELVKDVPEGVYLQSLVQDNLRVTLSGYAQSNERVSELLRNLGNKSTWIASPELVEIKVANANGAAGRDARRLFQFTLNVTLKRPSDAKPTGPDATPAGKPAAVSTPAAAPAAPSRS